MTGIPELRQAELADLASLVDLWNELVTSQRAYGANLDPADNEAVARQYFGRLLVEDGVQMATIDGEPVGFVSFELEPDQFDRERTVGIVENLYVRPPHRNTGLGTRLLRAAEDGLVAAGAEMIQLEAMTANERARSFYTGRGYDPYRIRYAKSVETDNANDPPDK